MKSFDKIKYLIVGFIVGILGFGVSFAAVTGEGTIGSLFEYIGSRYYLNGNNIKNSSIDSSKIVDNSITSSDILNGTIISNDLANDSVGTNQLNENQGYSVKGLVSTNGLGVTGNTALNGNLNVTGTINLATKKITGVATPTSNLDAANKAYVDSKVSGGNYVSGGLYGYCTGRVITTNGDGNRCTGFTSTNILAPMVGVTTCSRGLSRTVSCNCPSGFTKVETTATTGLEYYKSYSCYKN